MDWIAPWAVTITIRFEEPIPREAASAVMRGLGGQGRGPVTVGPNEATVHLERHGESIGDAVGDALQEVEAAVKRFDMPRGAVVSVAAYSTDDREANRMRPAGSRPVAGPS